ncbi:lactonase family protein [Paenibacillus pini]|uniref:6-phosphogluconolactonase n=1 Tax=Paenibacillus pini JCM 16418 TaxID=1236976 RepID=W7YLI8_9BACL|nr:lactonase family protein [Paenibacillus pini]GAF09437.1 6-phosphogluconolactonase [Paenibacillus pini JCM 16418]
MNSENQSFFYTGTYAPEGESGIFLCSVNEENGELKVVSSTSGIENPSFLALNAAEDRLYAVSEKGEGEVFAYAIDPNNGELSLLNRMSTEGADPCYVSLTPDGKNVLVSNYSGGNINVFSVDSNGALEEMTAMVKHSGRSIRDDRQDAPHPHSIYSDASGAYVFVCDLGLDQIIIYRLQDGKLSTKGEVKFTPGAGPRHLAFHPTQKWAYAINELDNKIIAFAYNELAGDLQLIQSVDALPEDYSGESYCADIHVSPCGRFLYGSNRGHDSIVLFHIDLSTGQLTPVDWATSGGTYPRNFAILKPGYVISANQNSSNIISLRMDTDTGRLTPTGYSLELPKPVCIRPTGQGK